MTTPLDPSGAEPRAALDKQIILEWLRWHEGVQEFAPEDLMIRSRAALSADRADAPVAPVEADSREPLDVIVEEFVGWWGNNREGSVNRTYDAVDKFVRRLRAALSAPSVSASVPQEDRRPERQRVTEQDLQDILEECGHVGDSFNIERAKQMGFRLALYPEELLQLVQTFLDAEHTRALLRGTFEGWKMRTAEKVASRFPARTEERLSERVCVEFGFRCAEKGWNLDRTLQDLNAELAALRSTGRTE